MLFSVHHIHWGSPPQPVTHETLWLEMTPEQVELLSRKCAKRDLYQAHLFTIAIGSAVSGKFTPLDLIDGPIHPADGSAEIPKDKSTPTQRRERLWGKWNWNIEKLYQFAKERGYDPTLYFEASELSQLERMSDHESKNEN